MLGIIIAMQDELHDFDNFILNCELIKIGSLDFYLNKDKKFVLVISGIGIVNASIATSILINHFKTINIINLGTVGSNSELLNIGQVALIKSFFYLDVDASHFKYALGQVPGEPAFFISNENLNKLIINSLNESNYIFSLNNLGTSSKFVDVKNINYFNSELINKIQIFDMEATASAQICYKFKIPFASIKIVSDNLKLLKTQSDIQFKNSLSLCSIKVKSILTKIINISYNY